MATISEVMQSIGKMPEAEEFKTYLRILRDAPLAGASTEVTYYNIGQRDLAIELLEYMEETEDE